MLATIIRDKFTWTDRKDIADALDDLCSPSDSYGWASAGVYAFWDVELPSLLYIGLASDLAQRFRQHVGLLSAPSNACKVREIKAHFANSDVLGYSALVQSPMSQPVVSRMKPPVGDDAEFPAGGVDAIKFSEGLLISAYVQRHDSFPPWNKVQGSMEGQGRATSEHCFLVDLLSGIGDDTMVARSTLREISEDPAACTFEVYLHGVRQTAGRGSFVEVYSVFPGDGTRDRIEAVYWPMKEMVKVEAASEQRFQRDYAGE